jgi:ATP-dependent DNA ligase
LWRLAVERRVSAGREISRRPAPEIKYDGWRLLARKDGDNVRLFTRGGVELSARVKS